MSIPYSKARSAMLDKFVAPMVDFIEAADSEIASANKRAERAEITLEVLRPVWAQGWTSDSQAAQASANALAELWQLLGVDNQTAAMERLRELVK